MVKSKTQQYTTASVGTLIGIITILFSFRIGILTLSGSIIGILGIFFGGAGILSFFNPMISNVLGQIMENINDNTYQKTEINQKQNKSINSTQIGQIKGNQTIYYGNNEPEKKVKEEKIKKTKIKKRLNEILLNLEKLKNLSFREGDLDLSNSKKEIKGIIHRVYSNNPEANEKRLISRPLYVYTSSSSDDVFQKNYLEDINELIGVINIIIRELDL